MSTGSSFDPQQALSKHVLNNFYVGGRWVEPQSDRKLELISPMTEECFVKVPEASNADVDRAVRAARDAFDKGPWPLMSPQERAKFVTAMGEELKKRLPLLRTCGPRKSGHRKALPAMSSIMDRSCSSSTASWAPRATLPRRAR